MKSGRFYVTPDHTLKCRCCPFEEPMHGDNPERNMMHEELLEATHVCRHQVVNAASKTRVLTGTNPQSLERAKFVLGFVN